MRLTFQEALLMNSEADGRGLVDGRYPAFCFFMFP